MVKTIGNALYSEQSTVLTLSLKCLAAIVKYPLKAIESGLPVFVRQCLEVIRGAGSTESELVQTALKTLAAVIRERPSAKLKEKDLSFLAELVLPDLEEPDRQVAIFSLLRAIMSRKFVAPEVYDIMDKVAEMMVTNQSPQVQELCRGAILQFWLDYPQGKGRLQKFMNFVAKNLSYVYESGRKSVMELLSAMFTKFDPNVLDEFADLLFVALVMVLANDDSAICREMSVELIKQLLQLVDTERRRSAIATLRAWLSQTSKPHLTRVAVQLIGIILDAFKDEAPESLFVSTEVLRDLTNRSAVTLALAEESNGVEDGLDWQLPYQLLNVWTKLMRASPSSGSGLPWQAVTAHLLFPHAWVRATSARLLGMLFAGQIIARPRVDLSDDDPLSLSGMTDVARKSCLQLQGEHFDEGLSLQATKNLVYIAKCFSLIEEEQSPAVADDTSDNESTHSAEKSIAPLDWLVGRLSRQARAAHIARRNRTVAKVLMILNFRAIPLTSF